LQALAPTIEELAGEYTGKGTSQATGTSTRATRFPSSRSRHARDVSLKAARWSSRSSGDAEEETEVLVDRPV